MHPVMGGPDLFDAHSPALKVQECYETKRARIPRLFLLHGTADVTVPLSSSARLHRACLSAGVSCVLRSTDMDHSTFLIELMTGALGSAGDALVATVREALGHNTVAILAGNCNNATK